MTPQPWLCSTWPSLGADASRRASEPLAHSALTQERASG
ncbi:MAG: hypothetical protein AVDCRST_MAG67-1398 [uncultured Solirubrobacteraceae bacterium]|uniref:Uncharacterized protein n=1 Tax=uncultured Solirubrobacteraceae bacterium TaxID=1162706 RepID=A0A6J4S7B5_9ACTN|nr:MAG: hypothetical protein AVDCRST_MAG67-1398 [uncultured Solirubrobacteraceae bacterium]